MRLGVVQWGGVLFEEGLTQRSVVLKNERRGAWEGIWQGLE